MTGNNKEIWITKYFEHEINIINNHKTTRGSKLTQDFIGNQQGGNKEALM